jgi:hypothetical protein
MSCQSGTGKQLRPRRITGDRGHRTYPTDVQVSAVGGRGRWHDDGMNGDIFPS